MTKRKELIEIVTVVETKNRGTVEAAKWCLEKGGIENFIEEKKAGASGLIYKLRVPLKDKKQAKELLANIQFLLDYEDGVGTYVKVIRQGELFSPDAFMVIYLRPGNRFLFLGYWHRHEYFMIAGHWTRRNDEVHLFNQVERTNNIVDGDFMGKDFRRRFIYKELIYTPSLYAADELTGWSLLGWRGTYVYVGQSTIFDPDGRWMPKSLEVVDEWINRGLNSKK